MAILNYENLTHQELSSLNRENTIVLLAVGPLEEHGIHLPLAVDALIARFFAEKMAEKLVATQANRNIILMPTIFAGSDTLVYAGSVEVAPRVLRALVYAQCQQLAKDGFKNILAFAAHGGPRHTVVLEEVAEKMRWRHKAHMVCVSAHLIPAILRGEYIEKIAAQLAIDAPNISPAQREVIKVALKTDYHAGLLETSIMLYAYPQLVKDNYKNLSPNIVSSFYKLRRNSAKKVGDKQGHLGHPALADKAIGQAISQVLLNETHPLLETFLTSKAGRSKFRSFFYYIPFLRTDFGLIAYLILWLSAFSLLFILVNRYLAGVIS